MSQLRFVKSPEELQAAAENNLEFFEANMVAVKAFYRTEPGLIEKLIPAPLTPTDDPTPSDKESTDDTNDNASGHNEDDQLLQPYAMQSTLPFPIIDSITQFDSIQA